MNRTPTLTFMLAQSGIYVLAWISWASYIRRRGPLLAFRTITKLNSWLYSFCSLIQLLLVLSPYLPRAFRFLAWDTPGGGRARAAYHWSKVYEYVDVFNVVAAGGEVDLHFGFHHVTTPWLTWVRVVGGGGGGGVGTVGGYGTKDEGWRLFAALNAAHHVLMYAFFGGLRQVRDVLVVTGMVQLAAGMAAEAWSLAMDLVEKEERWRCWVSLGLLACYFGLFLRDLGMRGLISSPWSRKQPGIDETEEKKKEK